MFTVVGSGFGLYGYVPALLHATGEPVILPAAYRGVMEAREDLRGYAGDIAWVADGDAALSQASGVVLATLPSRQPALVARCCARANIERIVVEKPLAVTPAEADGVLAALSRSGKSYRVGYTLLHAAWHGALAWPAADASIEWTFMAHHYAKGLANWKRDPAAGGGVVRFFGVHLIALLARHGYDDVTRSRCSGGEDGSPERWQADFAGAGVGTARVLVDSRATAERFSVAFAGQGAAALDLRDPFELETPVGRDDRRVPVLQRLLDSFGDDDASFEKTYADTNRLWKRVEEAMAR